MTTITLKVSEADKKFMQAIAKFEGVSLSELIRYIFRHTFASRFCENETNVKVIQGLIYSSARFKTFSFFVSGRSLVSRPFF